MNRQIITLSAKYLSYATWISTLTVLLISLVTIFIYGRISFIEPNKFILSGEIVLLTFSLFYLVSQVKTELNSHTIQQTLPRAPVAQEDSING